MIIQSVSYPFNQKARGASYSFRDGQYTRYVDIVGNEIRVCASDKGANGQPLVMHQSAELPDDAIISDVSAVRSGIDGKLIVTCAGFTSGGNDSLRITVKLNFEVKEPWEVYD